MSGGIDWLAIATQSLRALADGGSRSARTALKALDGKFAKGGRPPYDEGTAGHSSFASVDETDIGKAIGAVQSAALPNAKFYCSPLAYGTLFCRLGAKLGGLVATVQADGTTKASFMGFEVVVSSYMPAAAVGSALFFFGDLRRTAMLGQKRGLAIAVARQRNIDTDSILIRAVQRVHIVVHSSDSMCSFIGAS